GRRAVCAEREVLLGAAARVAVPFERDRRARPPLQPVGVLLQRRARVFADLGLVEIEEDVGERPFRVQLIHRLAREDLVFAERARRRGRRGRGRRGRRRRWRRGGNLLVTTGRGNGNG